MLCACQGLCCLCKTLVHYDHKGISLEPAQSWGVGTASSGKGATGLDAASTASIAPMGFSPWQGSSRGQHNANVYLNAWDGSLTQPTARQEPRSCQCETHLVGPTHGLQALVCSHKTKVWKQSQPQHLSCEEKVKETVLRWKQRGC